MLTNDGMNAIMNATFEITIGKRAGDTRTWQVKLGDFPANAVEKIVAYGVQRVFNDKVGGDRPLEDKAGDIEALLARWKAGDIGRPVAQGVDAVTAEARKIVAARLRKHDKPTWAKIKDRDDKNDVLDTIVAKNPDVVVEAEAEVKRRADEAKRVAKIDLGGIDL